MFLKFNTRKIVTTTFHIVKIVNVVNPINVCCLTNCRVKLHSWW